MKQNDQRKKNRNNNINNVKKEHKDSKDKEIPSLNNEEISSLNEKQNKINILQEQNEINTFENYDRSEINNNNENEKENKINEIPLSKTEKKKIIHKKNLIKKEREKQIMNMMLNFLNEDELQEYILDEPKTFEEMEHRYGHHIPEIEEKIEQQEEQYKIKQKEEQEYWKKEELKQKEENEKNEKQLSEYFRIKMIHTAVLQQETKELEEKEIAKEIGGVFLKQKINELNSQIEKRLQDEENVISMKKKIKKHKNKKNK